MTTATGTHHFVPDPRNAEVLIDVSPALGLPASVERHLSVIPEQPLNLIGAAR